MLVFFCFFSCNYSLVCPYENMTNRMTVAQKQTELPPDDCICFRLTWYYELFLFPFNDARFLFASKHFLSTMAACVRVFHQCHKQMFCTHWGVCQLIELIVQYNRWLLRYWSHVWGNPRFSLTCKDPAPLVQVMQFNGHCEIEFVLQAINSIPFIHIQL